MRVLVTAAARFAMTSDGNLWSQNESQVYNLWSRYLDVYDIELFTISFVKK